MSDNSGLFMIVMKSSENYEWPWSKLKVDDAERVFAQEYPSLHAHFKKFKSFKDPKTGKDKGLLHREDQGRFGGNYVRAHTMMLLNSRKLPTR